MLSTILKNKELLKADNLRTQKWNYSLLCYITIKY